MIRFHLVLLTSGTRWVAPAAFGAIFLALGLSPQATVAENSAFFFPVVYIISLWVAVIVGNIDDDAHREMVAASAGGVGKLHTIRAATAASVLFGFVVVLSVVVGLVGQGKSLTSLLAVLPLLSGGMLLGVGAGNMMCRPVVDEIGVAAVGGPLSLSALMLAPPIHWVLWETNAGSLRGAAAVFPAAIAAVVVLAGLSRVLLRRRGLT